MTKSVSWLSLFPPFLSPSTIKDLFWLFTNRNWGIWAKDVRLSQFFWKRLLLNVAAFSALPCGSTNTMELAASSSSTALNLFPLLSTPFPLLPPDYFFLDFYSLIVFDGNSGFRGRVHNLGIWNHKSS